MELRPLEDRYLDNLVKLVHATIRYSYPACYPPEVVSFFLDYHRKEELERKSKGGSILLGFKQDQLIGTGYLLNDEVGGVYVHPEFQKMGYGNQILDGLLNEAKANGLQKVWLDSTPIAKKLYLKAGFYIVEERVMYVENNAPLEYFFMEKEL